VIFACEACCTIIQEIGTVKMEQAECLTLERKKTMIFVAPVEIQHQLVKV
jgi:hypothetical protein